MSDLDVSQLVDDSLKEAAFPASLQSDFRLHFDPDVHAAIASHAGEDTSIEICGILVGRWAKDAHGPFAKIQHAIRCDSATSKNAEVTFTHESWSQINEEMDSNYADERIIGWYHSHPDFGIFLSDRDMFIQEHFFSGPGQVAYVVDPVREREGVFEWRGGKAVVAAHFWVGNRIVTSAASESEPHPASNSMTSSADITGPKDSSTIMADAPLLPSVSGMLAWLGVFLLGYLLSSWNSVSRDRLLYEGAVAHYGLWNVLQIGRAEKVADTRKRVELALAAAGELGQEHIKSAPDAEKKSVRDRWQDVRQKLADSRDQLASIEQKYSVPPEQRELLRRVIVDRLQNLTNSEESGPRLPVPVPVWELLKPSGKTGLIEKPSDKTPPPSSEETSPAPKPKTPSKRTQEAKSTGT